MGVPVLLVSGDDQAAIEANELIPNVTTAIVKEAVTRSVAKSLTPKKASDLLARQTASALSNRLKGEEPLVPRKIRSFVSNSLITDRQNGPAPCRDDVGAGFDDGPFRCEGYP